MTKPQEIGKGHSEEIPFEMCLEGSVGVASWRREGGNHLSFVWGGKFIQRYVIMKSEQLRILRYNQLPLILANLI